MRGRRRSVCSGSGEGLKALLNYFQPSVKLLEKVREGSKVKKEV